MMNQNTLMLVVRIAHPFALDCATSEFNGSMGSSSCFGRIGIPALCRYEAKLHARICRWPGMFGNPNYCGSGVKLGASRRIRQV